MRLANALSVALAWWLAACAEDPPPSNDDDDGSSTAASGGSSAASGGAAAGTGGASSSSRASSASSSGSGGATAVDPPIGASSGGSGGPAPVAGDVVTAGGISYRLIVPSSPASPVPLLIVFSGTEGGQTMTQNLQSLGPSTSTSGFIRAVLDGVTYNGNGDAGATVLDDVRAKYDVDNDRTYLLGESAGTTAALELGFTLRESYFAAYWANDVNASATPGQTAAQIGFAPWGQAGPGGQFALAQAIVDGMAAGGYQLPVPAPYAGTGAGTHGSTEQFIAALSWFPGKVRELL